MNDIKCNIIFDTIDNGILVLDESLNIIAWNRWLEIKSNISSEEIKGKNIAQEFPYINKTRLKRKIKSVLVTNNPAFYSVDPHNYLIDIKVNSIINKVFDSMQQDVTIVPYDVDKGQVCLYIYDKTKLYENNYELERLNKELKELSNRDPLTQVYNRRYFSEISLKIFSLAKRKEWDISLIVLDIDYFKAINDTYGHGVGDEVIVSLSRMLEKFLRSSDIIARFGGEEFVVLLNDANLDETIKIAEKIRRNIEKNVLHLGSSEVKFTLSLGIAQYDATKDKNSLDNTILRADNALYLAKGNGRNQVVVDGL